MSCRRKCLSINIVLMLSTLTLVTFSGEPKVRGLQQPVKVNGLL